MTAHLPTLLRTTLFVTLLGQSACSTPPLRTGEIPRGVSPTAALGVVLPDDRDPFKTGAPIDRVPHAIAGFSNATSIEYGHGFGGQQSDQDLLCSATIAFAAIQQDLHVRCGVLQETQGDPISIALGYKLSINGIASFIDGADSPFDEPFRGHAMTLDSSVRLQNVVVPFFNVEFGKGFITDRIQVRDDIDRNGNPYSQSTSIPVYGWMVRPTLGTSFVVSSEDNFSHEIIFGVTSNIRFHRDAYEGVEIALGYRGFPLESARSDME